MARYGMIPPPPPPPIVNTQSQAAENKSCNIKTVVSNSECTWASSYQELRLTCVRYALWTKRSPYKFKFKHVNSVAQVGPTCGLVAMCMLLDQAVSQNDLLAVARDKKFSNNGELFSAKWMFTLLQDIISKLKIPLKFELMKMRLFSLEIVEYLMNGCMLLVPYDCDRNFSPCLKNGHKAHWAIVTGVIVTDPIGDTDNMPQDKIFITAKHGKSQNVAVWKLHDLDRSNNNLEEFSPDREFDSLEYVVPEGGLGQGLRGQFLLIHPF